MSSSVAKDGAVGLDKVSVQGLVGVQDHGHYNAHWQIHRFNDPDGRVLRASRAGLPMEVLMKMFKDRFTLHSEFRGNLLLNEGIQQIWEDVAGLSTPTKWNAANARCGVGESSAGEVATQTGLQGITTTYNVMEATYPQRTTQICYWRSSFGSAEANYAWNEFTVVNGPLGDEGAADINLNRKVSSQGTKTAGQTWVLTIDITLS